MMRATAIVVALLIAAPSALYAHAALVKAEPGAGAVLTSSPAEVRLRFNEEVLPGISSLVLVQSDGTELNLRGANDSHDVHVLTAPLPKLAPGGYIINWKVTAADGHLSSGSYSFVVSAPPAVSSTPILIPHATQPAESLPILAPLLRGIGLTALLSLIGMLGFLRRAEGDRGPAVRPTLQWTGAIAFVALLLHTVVWVRSMGAPSWHAALDSSPGRFEQLRVILALVLWMSVISASKRSLGLLFGAMAIIVSAMIGHPASVRPWLSIPLTLVHLVGVAVWLGGVTWLVAHRGEPAVRVVIETARVSNAALFASMAVLLTGVAQSALFLPDFSSLTSTSYGLLLLAKIAGLLVLLGFGWHHRFRMMPKLGSELTGDFVRTLRYEMTVMAVVVVIASFLAYTPLPK
jgi:copper transport protein